MGAMDTAVEMIVAERQRLIDERAPLVAQIKNLDVEIRRLTRAHEALVPTTVERTPHGSRIAAVEGLMVELKKATQSTLIERSGMPNSSVKHAIGVLVERGVVRPTGEVMDRSPEYVLVGAASA